MIYKAPKLYFLYVGDEIPEVLKLYYNILNKCELSKELDVRKYSFSNSYILNINVKFIDLAKITVEEHNECLDNNVFLTIYLNREFYNLSIFECKDESKKKVFNTLGNIFETLDSKRIIILKDDQLNYKIDNNNFNNFSQYNIEESNKKIGSIPLFRKYYEFINHKINKKKVKISICGNSFICEKRFLNRKSNNNASRLIC